MHTRSRHAHMHTHSAFRCVPTAAPAPAATHPSCDTYMQPQVQALLQLLPIACEAVQHARHAAAPEAGRPQDLCKLCACIPDMYRVFRMHAHVKQVSGHTCWHLHMGGDACVLDSDATNMLSTLCKQPDTKQPHLQCMNRGLRSSRASATCAANHCSCTPGGLKLRLKSRPHSPAGG